MRMIYLMLIMSSNWRIVHWENWITVGLSSVLLVLKVWCNLFYSSKFHLILWWEWTVTMLTGWDGGGVEAINDHFLKAERWLRSWTGSTQFEHLHNLVSRPLAETGCGFVPDSKLLFSSTIIWRETLHAPDTSLNSGMSQNGWISEKMAFDPPPCHCFGKIWCTFFVNIH